MATYKRFEYFVGKGEPVDLTKDEFRNAKNAKSCLFPALFIEEQLDLILKNYAEFEITLYTLGLKSMMYFPEGWEGTIEEILLVNLRVVNLLTTCRMYVDHVPQKLHKIYGKGHQSVDDFEQATNFEYDNSLGYRFCYALRNFTQHNDLPVHGLLLDAQWSVDRTNCEHLMAVHTNIADLSDTDFNKTVLTELKMAYKEQIDIKPLIRQNVACIGRINEVVRKRLDPDIDRWEQWIKTVVGKAEHGSNPALGHFDDSGNLVEELRVSNDWAERLRKLLRKNMNATHYDKHFINGDVMPPKTD